MRMWVLGVFCAGILAAQQAGPIVRSIRVQGIATSPKGLVRVAFTEIAAAWKVKGVNLAVESPLDVNALAPADEVIREVYAKRGQSVRVEHSVSPLPPRSVEVRFEVIELTSR